MSALWRDIVVKRLFVRLLVSEGDIISGQMASGRSLRDMKMAKIVFQRVQGIT